MCNLSPPYARLLFKAQEEHNSVHFPGNYKLHHRQQQKGHAYVPASSQEGVNKNCYKDRSGGFCFIQHQQFWESCKLLKADNIYVMVTFVISDAAERAAHSLKCIDTP